MARGEREDTKAEEKAKAGKKDHAERKAEKRASEKSAPKKGGDAGEGAKENSGKPAAGDAPTSEEDLPFAVREVRKEARQFAMLYFHVAKVLVEEFGEDRARGLLQKIVFELAQDRANQLRKKADELGVEHDDMDHFRDIADLPFSGWVPSLGRDHCPYAQTWRTYFDDYPWFRRLAPFYCDVIDTTVAETLTRKVSHRITQNVLVDGDACLRTYFASPNVEKGWFTYGTPDFARGAGR